MARTAVHRIGIVVFDGVKLLDVAGPSEVFSEANRMGAHYELTLCAVGGGLVSSSTGMTIPAIFAQWGEACFRDAESDALAQLHARDAVVRDLHGEAFGTQARRQCAGDCRLVLHDHDGRVRHCCGC